MGLSLKTQRWAGADFWEQAAGEASLDLILERSEVVVIGIEEGWTKKVVDGIAATGKSGFLDEKQASLCFFESFRSYPPA